MQPKSQDDEAQTHNDPIVLPYYPIHDGVRGASVSLAEAQENETPIFNERNAIMFKLWSYKRSENVRKIGPQTEMILQLKTKSP